MSYTLVRKIWLLKFNGVHKEYRAKEVDINEEINRQEGEVANVVAVGGAPTPDSIGIDK